MKDLFWVFAFLTRIPFKTKNDDAQPNIRNVVICFPIVGLAIGMILALVYFPLSAVLPAPVADAIILAFYIVLTGALHLDGFADTCDGIFGGYDREKRLKIMRDSSIGVFGALGLICLIGIKYLCFHSICAENVFLPHVFELFIAAGDLASNDLSLRLQKCVVLFLTPSIGRWAQTIGSSIAKYARGDANGTGMFIFKGSKIRYTVCSAIIPFAATLYFLGPAGYIVLPVITIFSIVFTLKIKAKLGGMTGDTLGALNETSELIFVVFFLL